MAEIALLPCNSCSTSGKPSPFGIFTSYASPEIRVLTVQGINRFLSTVWCAQPAAEPSVEKQIRGSNMGYCAESACYHFCFYFRIFLYAIVASSNTHYYLENQLFLKRSQYIRIKNPIQKQSEKACMCFYTRCVRTRDFTVRNEINLAEYVGTNY